MQNISNNNNTHTVKLSSHINELIQRVIHGHATISVVTPYNKDPSSSAILKLVPHEYLLLDELKPGPQLPSERALIGKTVGIKAYVDGISLEFSTSVIGSGVQRGTRYYTVAVPREIIYEQKRGSFRVSTTISQQIPVSFSMQSGLSYRGELYDVSTGGISIALRNEKLDDRLLRGTEIPECHIHFPGAREPFFCQLELQNIRTSGHMQLVGTSFISLTPRQERELEKYVATMDRKRRRELVK
ncbi:MAG: flagellar brake protein [Gammaproteobacteria bacterium]|nr:flagellar brake protein [Gammaproteobacteria bacterium]